MKKTKTGIFVLALLLILVLASLPVFSADGTAALPEGSGLRSSLYTLSFELKLNEKTNEAESRWILENRGSEAVETRLSLPVSSAGLEPGSLKLTSDADAVRTAENEIFLRLGAGRTATFFCRYRTKSVLTNAGVIGFDFKQLVFDETAEIGHFSVSVLMAEEDLPLVKEIFPVNFTLEEDTVSLELYNFRADELLDRFWMSKETWRNLKGSREYEPNESQRFVLENYRRWFRDGLGLSKEALEEKNQSALFGMLKDPVKSKNSDWAVKYYSALLEGGPVYRNIMDYLFLRELNRAGVPVYEPMPDAPGRDAKLRVSFEGSERGAVVKELLRQIWNAELTVAVIDYTKEPSLKDQSLYRAKYTDHGDTYLGLFPTAEETVMAAEAYPAFSILRSPEGLGFRTTVLNPHEETDAAALQNYLDAVGAGVYARRMVLDDRDGRYDELLKDLWESVGAVYSAAGGGNLTASDLYSVFDPETGTRMGLAFAREDALLSQLTVPSFVQYTGWVRMKDGKAVYDYFPWNSYQDRYYGLELYEKMAKTDAGRQMLKKRDENRAALKEATDRKILAASDPALTELPVFESGDRALLRVLSCEISVSEADSAAATKLILENMSDQAVTACVALPVLAGGIDETSFTLSGAGNAQLLNGPRLLFSLNGGEALTVSYRYRTAADLVNAGAIGLDLKLLQPDPASAFGRLFFSVTLREEDIPLVKEIVPMNYRFEGTTVSVELFNYVPNALFDRIVIAKDSYRNLAGSRDYELNDAEIFIMKHYRKWFREGAPVPEGVFFSVDRLLPEIVEATVGREVQNSFWGLTEHKPAYYRIAAHLCLKELEERGRLDQTALKYFFETDYGYPGLCAPLTLERYKRLYYGEEPVLVAVGYAKEPSLEGVTIYAGKDTYIEENGKWELKHYTFPVDELNLLQARKEQFGFFWEKENLRIQSFPDPQAVSGEAFRNTLDAVGAELYIEAQLLDNRDGRWEKIKKPYSGWEEKSFGWAVFSVPAGAAFTAEDLERSITETAYDGNTFVVKDGLFNVFGRENSRQLSLGIPAFSKYYGAVYQIEGLARVNEFADSAVLWSELGLSSYRTICLQESAQQLLAEKAQRLEAERKAITERIRQFSQ